MYSVQFAYKNTPHFYFIGDGVPPDSHAIGLADSNDMGNHRELSRLGMDSFHSAVWDIYCSCPM